MTRFKDVTWEDNSLTHATTGVDSTNGSGLSLLTTTPIKGTYYMRCAVAGATSYAQEDFTASDNLYTSFYLRLNVAPTTVLRILELRTSGANTGGSLRISTGRNLRLFDHGGTQVGTDYLLTLDTIYRIGLEWHKGTGANGQLSLFVDTGPDAAFGTAHAATTTNTDTLQVSRIRLGSPTSGTITIEFDNIRFDDSAMPTDDVSGGAATGHMTPMRGIWGT